MSVSRQGTGDACVPVLAEERLADAAALAERLAPNVCTRAPGEPASCAWYHAFYPRLRVLDLAPTPERHATFYDEVFRALARGGRHGRAAISGAADACMLAHLVRAYALEGAGLAVEVVDRCATPLRLCEAYAVRAAADVRTAVADVRDWRPAAPVDLITTHAFVGMFAHAEQAAVVGAWCRALRAGGTLVSVARVDPDWTPERAGFSNDQAAAFRDLVVRRARERDAVTPAEADALAARAWDYALRMRSFPFASPAALVGLLEGSGLAVERLELVRVAGNAGGGESGPGTHRPGTFAHFVARAAG